MPFCNTITYDITIKIKKRTFFIQLIYCHLKKLIIIDVINEFYCYATRALYMTREITYILF